MQLPRTAWNNYITKLSQLNKTAANLMEAYLNATGLPGTPAERKALIDYAMALTEKYGTGAAALACEMYDELAIASGVTLPPAEPADIPDYGTVAKTVNGTMKVTDNTRYIASSIGRLVKQAGADTTLKNAKRDRKVTEFAWVPNGDTCSFCIMLASNGWRRMSKNALKNGHAEHIHANCDCEYAVRFDKSMSIEGYDPDKYYQDYVDSGRDVNEMRRIDYAKNKDAINARRRENYAKAHRKTGDMTADEYADYIRALRAYDDYDQIKLPEDEYAMMMSVFNSPDITEEERKSATITRAIRNDYYTVVNYGYDNYKLIDKWPIEPDFEE